VAGVTNELMLSATTKLISNRMTAVFIADTVSAAAGGAISGGIRAEALGGSFGRGAALGAMSSVVSYVALRAIEPALVKVDQSVRRLMSGSQKSETVATLELESLRGDGSYPIDSLNGHARLRYTPDGGKSVLYETYPDGLQLNRSEGLRASASTPKARLTVSQDLKFREFVSDPANNRWSELGNCTCFAAGGWRAAGQPQVNARSWLGIFNPNSLADTVQRRGD
jgi:hypothetical protein